jgi:S-adenosylmethionine-diacylglycerol 3-amino-3-carboxypropyl transferase
MFAQSWEDPICDLAALQTAPGETVFAITSGGDNVLGFLLTDAAEIIAVDLNPTQNYLLELKCAAFKTLPHSDLLLLLGVPRNTESAALYEKVRPHLGEQPRAFFDTRRHWFRRGLLTQGGFERYFAMLRLVLGLVQGRRTIEGLFQTDLDKQRDYYARSWNGSGWQALVRIGCSRRVLGNRLDPSWFEHSDIEEFGKHFLALVEHALCDIPARPNYFLAQILLGRYLNTQAVPAYLRPENFEKIRRGLGRLRALTADVGTAVYELPQQSVDCFALSNVFEYSPPDLFDRTCTALSRAARPGARFALRNLVARRSLADRPEFVVDQELSARLREQDRAFIYSRFEAATLAPTC